MKCAEIGSIHGETYYTNPHLFASQRPFNIVANLANLNGLGHRSYMPVDRNIGLQAPIQKILLVDEITRPEAVRFSSVSTPGHLLHLVEEGKVRQHAEDRVANLHPGNLVWYHQGEPVDGLILRAPWRFITVGFLAPALLPPPETHRVIPSPTRAARKLRALLQAWRNESQSAAIRSLQCMALLHGLLLDVLPRFMASAGNGHDMDSLPHRWWRLEKLLRDRLDHSLKLDDMARLGGLSARTAARACQAATGMTPAHRLKVIRLQRASSLLQLTDLPITEIALMTGYGRVQELSRDIRKAYGEPPREVRRLGRARAF